VDKQEFKDKIAQLRTEVQKTAEADQEITDDERRIVDGVNNSLNKIVQYIDSEVTGVELLKNDKIEISNRLQSMEEDILIIAGFDSEISRDETELMRVLSRNISAIKKLLRDESDTSGPPLPNY
jgi:hypothetical protein